MISLGKFQLQFQFSGDRKSIHTESNWELRDAEGVLIDQALPHNQRTAYRLHCLLEQPVCSYEIAVPSSFTLKFENGYTLTIYDDEEQYECFSIHMDGCSYYC